MDQQTGFVLSFEMDCTAALPQQGLQLRIAFGS
jgi:hypothetical protein